MPRPGIKHFKASVPQAFLMHAHANASLVKQVHADLLQHTSAYTAQNIVWCLALYDDGVYSGFVQQLPQQQTGGTAANNGYLCSHKSIFDKKV